MEKRRFNFNAWVVLDLEVHVNVKGWSTPARINGDPDDCHDSEGEEDREILAIEIDGKDLPEEIVESLKPYIEGLVEDEDITEEMQED